MHSVIDLCASVIRSVMKIHVFLNILFTFGSHFHSSGTCVAGCLTAAGRAKWGPPARPPCLVPPLALRGEPGVGYFSSWKHFVSPPLLFEQGILFKTLLACCRLVRSIILGVAFW